MRTFASPANAGSVAQAAARTSVLRRSLLWRIHFWAALIATPFALLAALTGLLYVFTPQIEARLYAQLDHVTPQGMPHALDHAVAVGIAAAPPGTRLVSVQPPASATDNVKLLFEPGRAAGGLGMGGERAGHGGHGGDGDGGGDGRHRGHSGRAGELEPAGAAARVQSAARVPAGGARAVTVYVDPYRLKVAGVLAQDERFSAWARTLHSRLLQGERWRWMIELAASWLMVMLITGVALWWPYGAGAIGTGKGGVGNGGDDKGGNNGGNNGGNRTRARGSGRAAWRRWHAYAGVALGLVTLVILLTGLTWSKQAGGQFRTLRDLAGQGPGPGPGRLVSAPLREGEQALNWQQAWDCGRQLVPALALQLKPPAGPQDVWRVQSVDRSQPTRKLDLALDASNGRVLYRAGWDSDTAYARATAVGIPFHRGEFGWWNQALLFLFGAGVLFSIVSGWTMCLLRRRGRQSARAPWLPPLARGAWRSAPPLAWLAALGLCWLMPLLAITAPLVGAMEWWLARGWRGRGAVG